MRLRCASRLLAFVAFVLIGGCSNSSPPQSRATTSSSGSGGSSNTGGVGGSAGATGGTGVGGAIGPIDPGKEAGVTEAGMCFECKPAHNNPPDFPAPQYCGRIAIGCRIGSIDCPTACETPGYTCGGSGIPRFCGAQPDSGACTLTVCDKGLAGKYCGLVDNP